MESLTQKRSRLRGELQQAYGDLPGSTRGGAFDGIEVPEVDVSGYPDADKAQWFAYQAAKARLVEAYAEGFDPTSGTEP